MIAEPLRRLSQRAIVRQGLRFAMAGGVATIVHFAVLIAAVELGRTGPVLASTIAYCVGISVSYTLNRRFTFGADKPVRETFGKYVALYLVAIALNAGIVWVLVHFGVWYLLAQAIAIGLILFWNFLGARYLVFR